MQLLEELLPLLSLFVVLVTLPGELFKKCITYKWQKYSNQVSDILCAQSRKRNQMEPLADETRKIDVQSHSILVSAMAIIYRAAFAKGCGLGRGKMGHWWKGVEVVEGVVLEYCITWNSILNSTVNHLASIKRKKEWSCFARVSPMNLANIINRMSWRKPMSLNIVCTFVYIFTKLL